MDDRDTEKQLKLISEVAGPLFDATPLLRESDILSIQWDIFKETGFLMEEDLVRSCHAIYWKRKKRGEQTDQEDKGEPEIGSP